MLFVPVSQQLASPQPRLLARAVSPPRLFITHLESIDCLCALLFTFQIKTYG
jgi:hypothetical protein